MLSFFDPYIAQVLSYWHQLPPQAVNYAIHAGIAVGMLFLAYFTYYAFRRGFGHERFKGRWYAGETLQALKQELYSGVRDGRIPDSETMRFLDRHVYGRESAMRKLNGNGWM